MILVRLIQPEEFVIRTIWLVLIEEIIILGNLLVPARLKSL